MDHVVLLSRTFVFSRLQIGIINKTIDAAMQALAEYILSELRSSSYCPVYEEQLWRLWPSNDDNREKEIRAFAQDRGLRLRYYCKGQCAVFDKKKSSNA
jgi:hypothetical protein